MYRVVAARDESYLGVFVVGVKTTGVFCRVGCPARTPLRRNCEFFPGAREALHAGYRACRRCRPLDRGRERPESVERLVALVESRPEQRLTDASLRELGIEPTTARRQFLRHIGITFHAYQRARRMGMALRTLQENQNMTSAMRAAGYASTSGFESAFTGIFGAPPARAREVSTLVTQQIATPLGPMVAVASAEALWLLEFHDRRALERELAWLRRRQRASIVPGANDVTELLARELEAYFAGERVTFRTPLALEGSEFQTQVWRALLSIAPGQTRSYAHIAQQIGRPRAVRAVGRANGDNRLTILVPCHRVIRADGSLCGYGGGLWRKQKLLELEARVHGQSGTGQSGIGQSGVDGQAGSGLFAASRAD